MPTVPLPARRLLVPCALAFASLLPAQAPTAAGTGAAPSVPPGGPGTHRESTVLDVDVAGRTMKVRAVLEEVPVQDGDGTVGYQFTALSYLAEVPADAGPRPVTFAFNGGPGSPSIWLHLGILGPQRVAVPSEAGNAGAPPYPLVDNPHTILDVTDLVFVDPVGTGWSTALGEASDEDYWGVDEDVASVVGFIRTWLTRHGRWGSPKYVLGESYGGIRGALLARDLKQGSASIGLNGVVFVSPAFDIQFVDGRKDDLTYVTSLPTYAVTAQYHGRLPEVAGGPEDLAARAGAFARGPYLRALTLGQRLPAEERQRVARTLASLTGLTEEYWLRANLRVDADRFRKELLRDEGRVVGRLDTRYAGPEVDAVAEFPDGDPMFHGIGSAYVAGHHQLMGEFGFSGPDRPFAYMGNGIFPKWKRSAEGQAAFSGWLDTVPALVTAMQENPELRVFCGNGWYDIATTVEAAEYNLSRPGIDRSRVTIRNYAAGHMMYVHEPSLEQMAADLRAFYREGARRGAR